MKLMKAVTLVAALVLTPFFFTSTYAHSSCFYESGYCTQALTPQLNAQIFAGLFLAVATFGSFILIRMKNNGPQLRRPR
jgi:hypothetical protein